MHVFFLHFGQNFSYIGGSVVIRFCISALDIVAKLVPIVNTVVFSSPSRFVENGSPSALLDKSRSITYW